MKHSRKHIKKNFKPNWNYSCSNCMGTPVVPISGLCGPCHFGTIDAILGEWWDPVNEEINFERMGL